MDAAANVQPIIERTFPNTSKKDGPTAKPDEWMKFAQMLGWSIVTMTAKANVRFEMSNGEKVGVSPTMMRDIMSAVGKEGRG